MLRTSAMLIGLVVLVGAVAQAVGGPTASVAVGLSAGAAMAFGTVLSTRAATMVTLVLGAAAALGAGVTGHPWLSGLAVAVMVLATIPANAYSADMLMLAPLLTMVFTVTDRGWPWWQAGLWGVVGGVVGLGIAALMRFGKRPPQPVPRALAVWHAVVLAVAAGGSVATAELLGLEHGYWVAVTLLVVLRPSAAARGALIRPRIIGTLAGAALALALLWLLPAGLLLLVAFGFLIALAAYAMSGNYVMQTLFLTPMLMIFLSVGQDAEATVELTGGRVLYTLLGAALAASLAWSLDRWDRRSGLLAATDSG
jgi:hypothetical protein